MTMTIIRISGCYLVYKAAQWEDVKGIFSKTVIKFLDRNRTAVVIFKYIYYINM